MLYYMTVIIYLGYTCLENNILVICNIFSDILLHVQMLLQTYS